jgi:hypothetical protein
MELVFDLGAFGDMVCSKSIIISCKSVITSELVGEFGSSTSFMVTLLVNTN